MKKIGSQTTLAVSTRLSLVVTALAGMIILAATVTGLWQVALAAPPPDGNPTSITGPTTINPTSQGAVRALDAADFDADAHADLAFGQANALRIKRNTGITTTQWGQNVTVGSAAQNIRDVLAVDLDRDGAPDLVSASANDAGASQLRLWQSPPSPFTDPWAANTLTTLAISLTSVTSADLDRNGTPDLVSGGLDGVLRLWSNPLTGTQPFATAWPSPATITTAGDQVRQVLVADIDRDGRPDIIQAAGSGSSGVVRLWQNPDDPFSTAWTVSQTLSLADTVLSIGVGDLDNDGAPDILAGLDNGEVIAWHNPILTGTQDFGTLWSTSYTLGDLDLPIEGLELTDVDHDGQLDVVATGSGPSSSLVVWRNTGQPFTGGWSETTIGNLAAPTQVLASADFNQDGDDDIVTATGDTGNNTGGLQFWANVLIRSSVSFETTGVLSSVADPLTGTGLHAMDIHDIDRDGRPDIVVATLGGSLVLLHNDGSPFANDWPSTTIGSSFGFFSVAVGDLDGDGWPDIATSATLTHTGSVTTGLVHIWHNDGTPFSGSWVSQTAGTLPRQVMDLALGDVAREGNLQIVAATGITSTYENYGNHDVPVSDDNALWLLRPPLGDPFASAWISSTVCTTTYSANGVALGDLDNDGWTDIVFGTDHAPLGTTQWPNTTGFYDGPAYQVRACRSLGDPYSSSGWQVYDVGRDDAPVSNARLLHSFWGAHVWNVAVSDLDNDGNLDVVSGGGAEGDYQVLVYANDGTPFSGNVWEPTAVGYGSRMASGSECTSVTGTYPQDCPWLSSSIVAIGVSDLNGDGWPDLLSGFGGSLTMTPLWINTGIPFGQTVSDTHWVRYNLSINPSLPVYGVQAADLDNDGRQDAAAVTSWNPWYSPDPGPLRVWRNLGGIVQHSFQTDYDLYNIDNGATESRLSIAIKHNGRSYDHNLELDSLKIHLLSRFSSLDMSTATANSLFQGLYIYRDANGDNIWQPSDSPVVTVTTFSLEDGYQTFAFPSGDPLSTISPGQTMTYFVVLEMQPAASDIAPWNLFQVEYTPHDVLLVKDQVTQATVSLEEGAWTYTQWTTAIPAPTGMITATASPGAIQTGGNTSTISATLTTVYGYPAVSGTVVTFTTSAGTFPTTPYTSTTTNDVATAILTSGSIRTTAVITATASAATDTVTVDFVGPRVSLRINASPGKDGDEVTTHAMTADDTLVVYAAAYDSDGTFIGNPTDVTWSGSGAVNENLSPTTGSETTTFAPVLVGTGVISVTDGVYSDTSGLISVTPGALANVVICDAAGGAGDPVNDYNMTTDDSLTLYAAGYDADGNYIVDLPVTWGRTGSLDPVSVGPAISTTLSPSTANTSGTITADDGNGRTDTTGLITVDPGALTGIVIRNATAGGGSPIGAYNMTTDNSLTLYAAGYDADNNYISDISVTWGRTGSLDAIPSGPTTSVVFAPSTANTSGLITANDGSGHSDTTGLIRVNPGALDSIVIRDATGGGGSEVGTRAMTTDDSLTLYAAGYDADNNYISDISVTWTATGDLDAVPGGPTTSVTFAPFTANTSGTISANDGSGHSDATGPINVDVGALDRIVIRNATSGGGSEVGALDMTTDDESTLYAAGYDADDNYISDISVTWTATGDLDAVPGGPTTSVTFAPFTANTSGTISADDGSGHTDATGLITVDPGALDSIVIRDATGGSGSEVGILDMTTDDEITLYAAGYDADDNYISDISVTWSRTGDLDAVPGGPTTSVTFAPSSANTSGTISADDGSGHTDATGLITVSVGALARFALTAPTPQTSGVSFIVNVAAYDADDNPKTNYYGIASLTSSDPQAILPTDDGTGWSNGAKSFTLEFRTTGAQTYTVQDGAISQTSTGITVNPGPLASFSVTAPSPQRTTIPFSVTVTAYDGFDNIKTNYNGSVNFTSSDPLAVLPSDDGTGWSEGAKDFTLEFGTTGVQTYTVQHGLIEQVSDEITVHPGPPDSFGVTSPTPQRAGVPFTITVTAYDEFTQPITNYVGPVSFTSSDPRAILPSDDSTGWSNGAKDFVLTFRSLGEQTYTVHDITVSQSSDDITVNLGPLGSFALTAPSPQQAGVPFSVTVSAYDIADNLKTDYSGVVSLTSSDPQAVLPSDDGTGWSEGAKDLELELRTTGPQTYTARDGLVEQVSTAITVTPGALSRFALTAPSPQQAGVPFSVTITAYDDFDNLKADYSGVVSITSSDPLAVLPTDDGTGWSEGAQDLAIEFRTIGTQTYSVHDGAVSQTSSGITVNPGPLGSFALGAPSPQQAGVPFSVTVSAYDVAGNLKTDYSGVVSLASSDPQAVLPTDDGSGWSQGAKDLTLELRTTGVQTYSVQDGAVLQTSDGITVTPGALGSFVLSAPSPQQAGVPFSVTVTAYDVAGNLKTDYAGPVSLTSSDAQAVLPTDSGGTGPSSWLDGAKDFTLELRTAGAQTYTAQDGDAEQTSDAITVNPGPLALIVIRDAAGGGGSQVISHTMSVNDSLTVYAAGYDAYDNLTSDVVVTWSTTGDLDDIPAGPAISATFTPTSADTSGTITADDGQGHTAATGAITVTVTGPPEYLMFVPLVTK